MIVIIAGCRSGVDMGTVEEAMMDSPFHIESIIQGGALGADTAAEEFAYLVDLPCETVAADWDKHGRAAGPIRNREMAKRADALIAIWDGKSKGTKNMIEEAVKEQLPVYIHAIMRNK